MDSWRTGIKDEYDRLGLEDQYTPGSWKPCGLPAAARNARPGRISHAIIVGSVAVGFLNLEEDGVQPHAEVYNRVQSDLYQRK